MTPEKVSLARGPLEYRWAGRFDPAKPAILLLHEGLGCVALWKDFPDQLHRATGWPVLAYSRYGYGGSAPCRLPRPLSYMHEEAEEILPELLRHFGIGRHVLFGHSDGASIALIHAGSGRATAGLLGVVAAAPHSFCEDISVRSIAEAGRAYDSGDLRARLERYHGANVDCAFRGWCDAWLDPAFRDWNIEGYVSHIRVPVLAVQGRQDEYGTLAQIESIEARVKGGVTPLILEACGHSPHRDQPAAVLEGARAFMARF